MMSTSTSGGSLLALASAASRSPLWSSTTSIRTRLGRGGFGQTVNVKGEEEAHGVRSVAEKRPARLVVLKVAS